MNIEKFIIGLQNSTESIEEYMKAFPRGEYQYSYKLIEMIRKAINNKDESLLELLLIIANHDGLDETYTELFCELLNASWHYSHEDIVMYLGDIKDPKSIDCIYNTLFFELDYDEGKSLAKKCIWALGAINTREALEKIGLLSELNNSIIKETALLELKRRRN